MLELRKRLLKTCPLCQNHFTEPQLDGHRQKCFEENREKEFYLGLRSSARAECPKCGERLRLWPVQRRATVRLDVSYMDIVYGTFC